MSLSPTGRRRWRAASGRRPSLPLRRLPPLAGQRRGGQPPQAGSSREDIRHFDKLTFRVAEEGPVDLYLANLRLAGPKGERVLDDFRQARTWRGGRQAIVPGPAPGQQALPVSLPRGASFLWRAGFDTTFSLADYDRMQVLLDDRRGGAGLEQFADLPRRRLADRLPRAAAAAGRPRS